jgi:hypothetical protein
MRFFGRSLTGLFLMALTLGLLGLAAALIAGAFRGRDAEMGGAMPEEERVIAANVVMLEPTDVTPVLTAFGEVRARRVLELRAKQPGTVAWVSERFENGASIKAGETLARFDPVPAQEALALAQADVDEARAAGSAAEAAVLLARDDLAAARAQVELRAQSLSRQEDLVERGVGSPQAVETAELAFSAAEQAVLSRRQAMASAEAQVDQAAVALTRATIALAEAERALAETELTAEFSGRLDGIGLVEGAVVGANESLGRVIDPESLEVSMRLSTTQFALLLGPNGELADGVATVALDVGGAEITATGRLVRVGASVGEGQTGRLVYVALDAAPGLRPGDFVTVRIEETPLPESALVPATAIGAGDTVLVVGKDDRLEEHRVDLLRRQGDDVIIGVGDLAGREIVAARSTFLGKGIKVRPVRPDGMAGAEPSDEQAMITLTAERRAALIALVEANDRMPADAKARVLEELQADTVSARMVAQLEERMGG